MKHTTLYGTMARSPCAYCKLKSVSLTYRQVRSKKCLDKQCWHLVKYEHPIWKQRDVIKAKKKANKAERKLDYGKV